MKTEKYLILFGLMVFSMMLVPDFAHASLESSLIGIKSKLTGSDPAASFRNRDCDCSNFLFHG